MGNTVLGILIMLVSTSMTNVGAVVQKRAVDRLPPFEGRPVAENVKNVVKNPLWLVGWLMGTVALVLNMVALGLADISVIQPLGGFGLVVLALFSRLYLGERLTPATLGGVGAVVAGVALIGASVPESRAFASAEELLGRYVQGQAIAALAVQVAVIFGLWALARRARAVAGILYAFVAAACSVTGLTMSKGLFGLFALIGAGAALLRWPSYLLLAVMLTFSTLAMMLQQMSFQKGRAVVVTPVFAASSVVLPLFVGRFVFGEQVGWATLAALLFIVVGVILLGMRAGGEKVEAAVSGGAA